MDITQMQKKLENCPCGRKHVASVKAVCIGSGLLHKTAEILRENGFPTNILVVADKNTLHAADGILEVLEAGGFDYILKLYDDLRTADMVDVNIIEELLDQVDGVLSVGSGSLNDICRLAAFLRNKEFAIFATAPSMDGFASDSSPITENNFKRTIYARQPSIIIGDTKILAAAPAELKAAGFGDMIAKYIAQADWKISHLLTGEYYCDDVAGLTRNALEKLVSMADRVTQNDEETAGAIMEALVLPGFAMTFAGTTRAASGTEHIISHYWEIKKLEKGLLSDFHGKKVGVATLFTVKMYKALASLKEMRFHGENLNWNNIYAEYGPNFASEIEEIKNLNITKDITPEALAQNWPEICRIVNEEIPSYDEILSLMKAAGAALTIDDIAVSKELCFSALKYHPFMRDRITLWRLIPMMDIDVNYQSLM